MGESISQWDMEEGWFLENLGIVNSMPYDEAQQTMTGMQDEVAAVMLRDDAPPVLYEETNNYFAVASILTTQPIPRPNLKTGVEEQSSDDSNESKKTSTRRRKRTREPSEASHHIMSERKRRHLLAQQLISLASLLPNLRKMDKSTILGEAIEHMKQLKGKVEALEEAAAAKQTVEAMVVDVNDDDSSCIVDHVSVLGGGGGSSSNSLPEIEPTVSNRTIILKLYCGKQKGMLAKLIAEMEKYDIIVLHFTVLPLGNSINIFTFVGQIMKKDKMRTKDLTASLNSIIHAS